jgi:hypothetical protein
MEPLEAVISIKFSGSYIREFIREFNSVRNLLVKEFRKQFNS